MYVTIYKGYRNKKFFCLTIFSYILITDTDIGMYKNICIE